MSGGSLDYLYSKVEEASFTISQRYGQAGDRYEPKAVAFAKLLMQVSKALHDIEWDMSGDGSDWKEVDKLIGPKEEADAVADHLRNLIIQAEAVLKRLK
jgi:hypothetical protein